MSLLGGAWCFISWVVMSRAALCVRGACYQGNGARLDPRAGSGVWRVPGLCYFELTGWSRS